MKARVIIWSALAAVVAIGLTGIGVEAQQASYMRQDSPVARQSLTLYSVARQDAGATTPATFGTLGGVAWDTANDCPIARYSTGWHCIGSAGATDGGPEEWEFAHGNLHPRRITPVALGFDGGVADAGARLYIAGAVHGAGESCTGQEPNSAPLKILPGLLCTPQAYAFEVDTSGDWLDWTDDSLARHRICTMDDVTCGSAAGTIGGTIADTQVAFGSAANTIAGSANFTWTNSNPSLLIQGTTGSASGLVIKGNNSGNGMLQVYDANATLDPSIITFASRGTIASPTAVQANDMIFGWGSRAYGTSAYATVSQAGLNFYAGEAWTNAAHGSYVDIYTTPIGSATPAFGFRLDDAGNVGIGTGTTSTAAARLIVRKTSGSAIQLINYNDTVKIKFLASSDGVNTYMGTLTNHLVNFVTNDTNRWTLQAAGHLVASTDGAVNIGAIGANRPDSAYIKTNVTVPLIIGGSGTTQTLTYKTTTGVGAAGADHVFQIGNNGATEAMRILNNGSVGIGTNSPATSALLDLTSTTKSLLVTRMTTAQQTTMTGVGVSDGMIMYDSTLNAFSFRQNGAWVGFTAGSGTALTGSGSAGQVTYWAGASSLSGSTWSPNIIYVGGAAGNPPQSIGSAGTGYDILQSNGAGSNPSWTSTPTLGSVLLGGPGSTQTALNYYKEGTFTPTVSLVGGAGNTTPVYTTNSGRYTRIGNKVNIVVALDGDGGAEGAGTGAISIDLPFTVSASQKGTLVIAGYFKNVTQYVCYVLVGASGTIATVYIQETATSVVVATGDHQNQSDRTISLDFWYEI